MELILVPICSRFYFFSFLHVDINSGCINYKLKDVKPVRYMTEYISLHTYECTKLVHSKFDIHVVTLAAMIIISF